MKRYIRSSNLIDTIIDSIPMYNSEEIKVIWIGDEHTELPNDVIRKYFGNYVHPEYCTYAYIEVNDDRFPVAFQDYREGRKQKKFVNSEPIWNFIKDKRTPEQQAFIDSHLKEISDACLKKQGRYRY